MCGRFTLYSQDGEIRTRFHLSPAYELHLRLRWNIAPGNDIVAITAAQPRILTPMRWGLIPSWAKDAKIGFKMTNARGETVPDKPAFRTAFRKRRCIIPASGWYEWRKNADGTKTPMYFHPKDGGLLALAGLWGEWTSPEAKLVTSCTLITVAAVPAFAAIHDRMPLVLGSFEEWLREDAEGNGLRAMLAAPKADGIEVYPVSTMVNRPQMDSADCIRPV